MINLQNLVFEIINEEQGLNSYPVKEVASNVWKFKNINGTVITAKFNVTTHYFECNVDTDTLDTKTVDTICKVIRDSILPRYILSRIIPEVKIRITSTYKGNIYKRMLNICKNTYEDLIVNQLGPDMVIAVKPLDDKLRKSRRANTQNQ